MSEPDVAAASDPLHSLTHAFLLNYPLGAARKLEAMAPADAAGIVQQQKLHVMSRVFEKLAPRVSLNVLLNLPDTVAAQVLETIGGGTAVSLLGQIAADKRRSYLEHMSKATADEFEALLQYPDNTVGQLMNPDIIALNKNTLAGEAIAQLRQQRVESLSHLFLLDDDMKLLARVDLQRLILAAADTPLEALASPVQQFVQAMDSRDGVLETLGHQDVDILPVVDMEFRLVGVLEGQLLLDAVREDLVADIQTMVGASKDEGALSSSFFAVKKRLPWLQINLLTAFLAASVVGIFESTIAQFTALAVLLPIAAGQAGNAGAQALAVTMRGLTLREITMRHWHRVMLKELAAGFVNGLGVAATCSLGVYVWSRSLGLALVMALAMVLSMTMAGIAGALVPIALKRFGLDPAQASSIVLTTVTDIAGFMSFLGIATLLAELL